MKEAFLTPSLHFYRRYKNKADLAVYTQVREPIGRIEREMRNMTHAELRE